MDETFGSTCHGAGRAQSRNKSRRNLSYQEVFFDHLGVFCGICGIFVGCSFFVVNVFFLFRYNFFVIKIQ